MHNERHLAAARRVEGVCVVFANSNSNIERGEVTKRRRWFAISAAISGKLYLDERHNSNFRRKKGYLRTRIEVDFKAAS